MIDSTTKNEKKTDKKQAGLFVLSLAVAGSGAGISFTLKDLTDAVKVGNELYKTVKQPVECKSSFTVKPVPIK